MKALPFILYFIDGHKASPEQVFEGSSMPAKVQFRNAREVGPNDNTERCDGVFGAVPEVYKDFPTAQEAIKAWEKGMKAERARLEDKAQKSEREFPAETKAPMQRKAPEATEAPEEEDGEASTAKPKSSWGSKGKK